MSIPSNPLDKFVIYTYHFELHAHNDWKILKSLIGNDSNQSTNRFTPNKTLIINTRKDAHQVIDDVHFVTLANALSKTDILVPISEISLKVIESGGFSFIEKLDQVRRDNQVTFLSNLQFLLKIFFVGRDKDNNVSTIEAKVIPMILKPGMSSIFNEKGSEYSMQFLCNQSGAAIDNSDIVQKNYAFVKRNISFEALTVEGALTILQTKLNEGYEDIYETEGYSLQGKKLKYNITFDPEIKGPVDGLNTNNLSKSSAKHFMCNSSVQIASFINNILRSSKELNTKIGNSAEKLLEPFHAGIFIPVIQPTLYYRADTIEVNYHIAVNRGGGIKYEFDYFFADSGKNVDIMAYEVKFNHIGAWVPNKSLSGYDEATNQSGKAPTERTAAYVNNICHPDTTRTKNHIEVERTNVMCDKNDPKLQPINTKSDSSGYNSFAFDSTMALRISSDTYKNFNAAIAPQQTLEIRGNLDFLNGAIAYPDGSEESGITGANNTWIKVNIFMPDAREQSGKRQFSYTGYYKLLSITNNFNNGQFKQQLSMIQIS